MKMKTFELIVDERETKVYRVKAKSEKDAREEFYNDGVDPIRILDWEGNIEEIREVN